MDGISSTFPSIQEGSESFSELSRWSELVEVGPEPAFLPIANVTGSTSRKPRLRLGERCRSTVWRSVSRDPWTRYRLATHGQKTIPVRLLKASSNRDQTRLQPETPGRQLEMYQLLRIKWTRDPKPCYLMSMYQAISIQGT